jgi:hypothetical protein
MKSEIESYAPRYRHYVAFMLAPDRAGQAEVGPTEGDYLPVSEIMALHRRHSRPVTDVLKRHGYNIKFDALNHESECLPDQVLEDALAAVPQVAPLTTRQALYSSLANRPASRLIAAKYLERVRELDAVRDRGEFSEREVLLSNVEAYHAKRADIPTFVELFHDPVHGDVAGFAGLILFKTKYDRGDLTSGVVEHLRRGTHVGFMLALAVKLKAVEALPLMDAIVADKTNKFHHEATVKAKLLRKRLGI